MIACINNSNNLDNETTEPLKNNLNIENPFKNISDTEFEELIEIEHIKNMYQNNMTNMY